jgi:hypothetical protein
MGEKSELLCWRGWQGTKYLETGGRESWRMTSILRGRGLLSGRRCPRFAGLLQVFIVCVRANGKVLCIGQCVSLIQGNRRIDTTLDTT